MWWSERPSPVGKVPAHIPLPLIMMPGGTPPYAKCRYTFRSPPLLSPPSPPVPHPFPKHSRAREDAALAGFAERGFGRLKGRWRPRETGLRHGAPELADIRRDARRMGERRVRGSLLPFSSSTLGSSLAAGTAAPYSTPPLHFKGHYSSHPNRTSPLLSSPPEPHCSTTPQHGRHDHSPSSFSRPYGSPRTPLRLFTTPTPAQPKNTGGRS